MERVWRKLQGRFPASESGQCRPSIHLYLHRCKAEGGGGPGGTSPVFDKWDWAAPLGAIVQAVTMVERARRTMRMSEVEINGGSLFSQVQGRMPRISQEYHNWLLI